jgi:NTE family protein
MRRFTVVLGGGGYAGTAFHAGVLTALARAGWDARAAEALIGTSAGAASAALIGAGFPPREYVALVLGERLSQDATAVTEGLGPLPLPPRPGWPQLRPAAGHLLRGDLRRALPRGVLLAAATPAGTIPVQRVSPDYGPAFQRWPAQQVWITAVELERGRRVVFGRDAHASLAESVSASVAIPGYFAPVVIDGVSYVDGGAWSTNNTDLASLVDAELVFVSAPSSTPDPLAVDLPNILRIPVARQLAAEVDALRSDGRTVVVFEPDRRLRRIIGINSMAMQRRGSIALASAAHASSALGAAGVPG